MRQRLDCLDLGGCGGKKLERVTLQEDHSTVWRPDRQEARVATVRPVPGTL